MRGLRLAYREDPFDATRHGEDANRLPRGFSVSHAAGCSDPCPYPQGRAEAEVIIAGWTAKLDCRRRGFPRVATTFTASSRRGGPGMRRLALMMLVVAAACPRFVFAQVTATQGNTAAEKEKQTDFASPMVLDIPFPGFRNPPGKAWTTTETSRYFCEGVSIESLTLIPHKERKRELPNGVGKERVVPYELAVQIRVLASHDRRVTLHADLRHGDRVLASSGFIDVEAEEKKVKYVRTSSNTDLFARVGEIEALIAGGATPTLHLRMSVAND